jgi:hypothetical protein
MVFGIIICHMINTSQTPLKKKGRPYIIVVIYIFGIWFSFEVLLYLIPLKDEWLRFKTYFGILTIYYG